VERIARDRVHCRSPAVIIGLTSLTFTGAGSVSIVARQAGDTNWNAAVSVTNTFTVNLTDQAALHFTPASPQTYGTTNSLTALEPSGIGLFGVLPPSGIGTGAVSYAVQSGPGAIVESNLLTVTSGTGSVVVVATKAADVLYNARSATATVVCAKAGQVITFDAIDDQFWTNVVTLAATASSGLTLHLDVLSGPAAIDEAILSFSGYGEVSLAAAQAGNDNYSAAVSVTNSFNVSGPQLLVLGTLLEGHADHVMDAVGPAVVPSVKLIRRRFDDRRQHRQPPVQRLMRALLGVDAKLSQYTRGKAFVDHVVNRVGMTRFNAVWTGAHTLPFPDELENPQRWIDRVL
jgi:hypothetical protein